MRFLHLPCAAALAMAAFAVHAQQQFTMKLSTPTINDVTHEWMKTFKANSIVARRPNGVTIAMHTCRGNYQGHWAAEGGYDPVAERVFNEIKVDALFLEYDTPRAGDFTPLRFFPKDKVLVLGLVSTKTPKLEDAEALKRRIDEAAKYVDLDRLCISPQCGFSSNYLGNPVTIDDEKRKLELVVKTAESIWGSA